MTRSLTISVHSMVDLITNSSSEIFISAKDSSVKTIKKMIASIIAASGSTKTVNELFTIEPAIRYETGDGDDVCLTDTAAVTRFNKFLKTYKSEPIASVEEIDEFGIDDFREKLGIEYGDEKDPENNKNFLRVMNNEYTENRIVVTALTPEGKDAAKILSALEELFDIESQYC